MRKGRKEKDWERRKSGRGRKREKGRGSIKKIEIVQWLMRERRKIKRLAHRRRIELEDKAKVVASDWGTESLPR